MLGHFEGFQFQGHETLALIVDFSSGGLMTYDISPISFHPQLPHQKNAIFSLARG